MNAVVRILLDENTGAPFVAALRKVAELDRRHNCEIAHTIDLFGKGAKDQDWVPRIMNEGWLLVTEDRGRNSRQEERLPQLCQRHSVTHVLVLPALLKRGGQFEKMRALLAVWPELLAMAEAQKGLRARLKYSGPACSGFRLERVVEPAE